MENKEVLLDSYTKPLSFSSDFESYDFLDDVKVADEFDSEEEYEEALERANTLMDSMCIDCISDMKELDTILYELAYHRVVIDLPLRDALLDLLESDDDLTIAIEKIRSYNNILQKKHVVWSYHEWVKENPIVDEDLEDINDVDSSHSRSTKYREEIKELTNKIDALKKLKGVEEDDESYLYVIDDENLKIKGMKTIAHTQIEFILDVYRCKVIKNIDQVQFLLWRMAHHRLKITPVVFKAIVQRVHTDDETMKKILRLIYKYKFLMQNKQGGLSLQQYYEHLYNIIKNKIAEPSYDDILKEVVDLKEQVKKLEKSNSKYANLVHSKSAQKKYNKTYRKLYKIARQMIHRFLEQKEGYNNIFDFRKGRNVIEFFTCCLAVDLEVTLPQIEAVYDSYINEVKADYIKSQYESYLKNLNRFREFIRPEDMDADDVDGDLDKDS